MERSATTRAWLSATILAMSEIDCMFLMASSWGASGEAPRASMAGSFMQAP